MEYIDEFLKMEWKLGHKMHEKIKKLLKFLVFIFIFYIVCLAIMFFFNPSYAVERTVFPNPEISIKQIRSIQFILKDASINSL